MTDQETEAIYTAATNPHALLWLCRQAVRRAPMMPTVQSALFDALTLCSFHFGGHSTFFADNHQNAQRVAAVLQAWVDAGRVRPTG